MNTNKGNENDDNTKTQCNDGLPCPMLGRKLWRDGAGAILDCERTKTGISEARGIQNDWMQTESVRNRGV